MKKYNKYFLFLFLFCFCVSGVAKTKQKQRRNKQNKRVKIQFNRELLEGGVSNPNIFHLFQKSQIKYSKLVQFRKNFLPEMRRTLEELKE